MVDLIGGLGPNDVPRLQAAASAQTAAEEVVGRVRETEFSGERSESEDSDRNLDERQVGRAVQEANRLVESFRSGIRFEVNKENGELVVQIVDQSTDKVIKKIPAESVVRLQDSLKDVAGLMIDSTA